MRQVREVLRLKHVCGHSGHRMAAMIGVSRYTVPARGPPDARQRLLPKPERKKVDRGGNGNDECEDGRDEHDSRRMLEPGVEQDEQERP